MAGPFAVVFLLAAAVSAQTEAPEPRDAYAFVLKRGKSVSATAFSAPDKNAVRVEDRSCFVGVFDEDQRYQADARGRPLGRRLICKLTTRTRAGQVSFTDMGCMGRDEDVLIEGPGAPAGKTPPGKLRAELSRCLEGQLENALSSLWTRYVNEQSGGRRGPKPGDPALTLQGLDELGRAYYRFYGRDALKALTKQKLWSYGPGGKASALTYYEKTAWWGADRDTLSF